MSRLRILYWTTDMNRWRTIWIIAANSALLYCVLVVATLVAFQTHDAVMTAWLNPDLSAAEQANYAHMTRADRDELLEATVAMRFRYEPVVGFAMREMTSRFVNIDGHGIRSNGPVRDITALQGAIWFLGGSTGLGFGVADRETIPAQLEVVTGRPVVNLAVNNYSSTEENLLFNHYLRIGYGPAVVIFFDGINETCEPDLYHEQMGVLVERAQDGHRWDLGGAVTYAYDRVTRNLRRLIGIGVDPAVRLQTLTCVRDGQRNALSTIHARRLAERAALCQLYEIDCRTLVQPFGGVHGRIDAFERGYLERDARFYRELFGHLEANFRAAGAVFVHDALDDYDRHAFVDEVHYSADASRRIAETIASRLNVAQARSSRSSIPKPDSISNKWP